MVSKIVNLLFADIEENEETAALREEVLNNCQERYDDLIAQGRSEDEALDAVVESLHGMEEVLAPYRRQRAADGEEGTRLNADGIRKVRASLFSFSLDVRPSGDASLHAAVEGAGSERIHVEREGDTLVLREERTEHMTNVSFTIGDSIQETFASLKNFFGQVRREMCGGKITLLLPEGLCPDAELNAASGDIFWTGCSAESLRVSTASGDVEAEEMRAAEVSVKTASGDVRLECGADRVTVESLSGDIEWRGSCQDLRVKTTSGDIEAEGSLKTAAVNSVSGDLSMDVENADAREITVRTTSGDVRIFVPDEAKVQFVPHTVVGDVSCSQVLSTDPTLVIRVNTVSGDIKVK